MDNSEFSFENLNTLCWAAGSISGSLPDNDERTFFIKFLKNLLKLVEMKKGKEAKATIASNIMYIVG
jgi:exportin-1